MTFDKSHVDKLRFTAYNKDTKGGTTDRRLRPRMKS